MAVAQETCVLGHAWQDGRVLCPVCGFGHRVTPVDGEAEQVTVTAVVAMPAAREGEVTSATVSPDGHWAWDGDEWVPASMSTIGASTAPAAASSGEVQTGVPAARAPIELADGETSTWSSRDVPRSLRDPDADRDHVPAYEDREPAPIPMPADAAAPRLSPADVAAAAAAEKQEAQTLDDLARLLALADVPEDEAPETAPVVDAEAPTVAPEPIALEPIALAPIALEPIAVAPVAPESPLSPSTTPSTASPETSADLAAVEVAEPSVPHHVVDDEFLEPYLEFEGPADPVDEAAVPVEAVAASEPAAAPRGAADPSGIASIAPISIVLRPSTATEGEDDTADADPRRSRRLAAPDVHLSPNGLRAAAVVVVALVSTVIATGHSPFAHHAAAAPKVDTVLQGTLRAAGLLETRYASEHGSAGLRAATLTPGGYHPSSTVSLSVARTSGQGFCLVGSGPVAGIHAYELYDSARGGLVSADGAPVSFPTQVSAQVACHGAGAFRAL